MLAQDDKAGALARQSVYNSLAYAARRIPEITDQLLNVVGVGHIKHSYSVFREAVYGNLFAARCRKLQ